MPKKNNAELKADRERAIFDQFSKVAKLLVDPGSIQSDVPPNADIRCKVGGKPLFCEMAEISDESVAASVAESLKTGAATGGAFSQDEPLQKVFADKSLNQYAVKGADLHLLAYYDKQYPLDYDPTFIPDTIGETAKHMVGSGKWQKIWVYDTWEKRILWSWPP